MKNYLKLSLSAILLILLTGFQQGFAQMKTLVDVQKSFSGITKIEVNGGALEVVYSGEGQSNEISVDAFLESTFHDQDIIFVTAGNILKISHKVTTTKTSWTNTRTKGHIKIQGPQNMGLDIKGGSGTVTASHVKSSLTSLSVGSGKITGTNIEGDVEVKAGSGSIRLQQIAGNIKGNIGSGSAQFQDVKGDIQYASSSGGITANNIVGKMNISLTSGNAKLENVAELGELRLTSGNLNAHNSGLGTETSINGTSGNFKIQTNSNLTDFNYNLNATSGNITVGNSRSTRGLNIDNGAAYSIKGNITSGNITIQN